MGREGLERERVRKPSVKKLGVAIVKRNRQGKERVKKKR